MPSDSDHHDGATSDYSAAHSAVSMSSIHVVAPPRQLTAVMLMFYALAYTIGAPVGMTPLLREGGPVIGVGCLVGGAVLYALPQSFIAAEMASIMPTQAGPLVWVTRTFGVKVGFYYVWIQMLQFLADISAACALAAQQVRWLGLGSSSQSEGDAYLQDVSVRLLALMLSGGVAVLSISQLSKAMMPLMVLVVVSTVAGFVWSLPAFHEGMFDQHRMHGDAPIEPTKLISTTIWLFAGLTAIATAGGETKTPRTMLIGLTMTSVAMGTLYLLAMLVMIAQFRDQADLHGSTAFLLTAYARANPVIGQFYGVVVLLSTWVNVSATIASNSRFVWGIASMGWAPQFATRQTESNGAPYMAVLVLIVLSSPFALMTFSNVLALLYTAALPAIALPALALLRLRRRLPELNRPVQVPGGEVGLWLAPLILVLLLGAAFVIACTHHGWIFVPIAVVNAALVFVMTAFSGPVFSVLRSAAHEIYASANGDDPVSRAHARGLLSSKELPVTHLPPGDAAASAGSLSLVPTIAGGVPVAAVLASKGFLTGFDL